ncbi:MAG: CDP-diacylglycerol--glycerol-3-phosphate 3-phosphatidyltransferase [Candidatus Hydrogenedentes bacterium]|nr:CDP-diacylglycerol--glycerol-3-phosphate 3-phosphatidyltransferase [Candidatus Hydrogenedentota bacterium]
MNLPNRLTMARVAVIPIFIVLIRLDTFWGYCLSLAAFVGAALTDYYDGKIARRRNSVTNFGKLLDPVADKVLIAAAFISFLDKEYVGIPSWVVIVIVGRELLVTGFRSIAASSGVVIGAEKWGKLKTVSQMICAITILALISGREAISRFFESASDEFLPLYDQGMRLTTVVMVTITMLVTVVSALILFQEHRRFLVSPGAN